MKKLTGVPPYDLGPLAHLRHLVGEHDWTVADPDFRVHDLSIGTGEPHHFFGTQCVLVELNSLRRTGDEDAGGDSVIALRDGWGLLWHDQSPADKWVYPNI